MLEAAAAAAAMLQLPGCCCCCHCTAAYMPLLLQACCRCCCCHCHAAAPFTLPLLPPPQASAAPRMTSCGSAPSGRALPTRRRCETHTYEAVALTCHAGEGLHGEGHAAREQHELAAGRSNVRLGCAGQLSSVAPPLPAGTAPTRRSACLTRGCRGGGTCASWAACCRTPSMMCPTSRVGGGQAEHVWPSSWGY